MSTSELIPVEEIQRLLPSMNVEQTVKCLRLVKFLQQSAPVVPQKPISVVEMINLESNLAKFFEAAWKVIEPGRPLLWSWHYELLAEYLTLVAQKKLRRLIINVPPRTAKSNFVTMCFPAWMWLQNPAVSFLFASYSNSLSTDHSVMRRNLIQSQWYQSLWGDRYQLAQDRNLTTQYSNDKMGQMISTSTGSGAEGRGGDIAILDDPMSSQQALSDMERHAANTWISNTLKQRLNDPSTASIIVIMQRLHELDTTGFVTQEDPGIWQKVEIPLVAEKDEEWHYPISGKVHVRKKGEVLQPERFTPEIVSEKQRNRLVYAGQYQQHPSPLEGNMIKRSEVMYYGGIDPLNARADEELPQFDRTVISVDCAFKDLKTSDYVAIGVIGVKGRKRFLLNVINAHLDADATEKEIRRQRELYPEASAILVEDKANGPAVIQRLKTNVTGVIEITPEGGKIARMFAAAPEWQAGDWYVDRNALWTGPFVDQITMFPTAANDDMCDMMSQAAIYLRGSGASQIYGDQWSNVILFEDGEMLQYLFENRAPRYIGVECSTQKTVAFVEIVDDGETAWQVREFYWDAVREGIHKTDAQYASDLIEFAKQSPLKAAPQVMLKQGTTGFSQELLMHGMWITENKDEDETVVAGIRIVSNAFRQRRLRIHKSCTNTIREHQMYCWNPNKLAEGTEQPLKHHNFTCDALRRVAAEIFQYSGRLEMKAA